MFTRYLRDYLLTDKVLGQLITQVQPVVNLKTRDEAARRRARRKYVRIILNDYLMNPGPSRAAIESDEEAKKPGNDKSGNGDEDYGRFGLMATLVKQWATRLPMARSPRRRRAY